MAIEYKQLTWWYWLASAVLLTSGVAGNERAFMSLILLSSWQVLHYFVEEESLSSFRVQVRLGYVLFVAVAFLEPMRALYLIPLCGTWANVLFGYCPLARALTLAPWNRREPLSVNLLGRTFFAPPTRGEFRPTARVVATDGWAAGPTRHTPRPARSRAAGW